MGAELGSKELGLLHELVPMAHAVAMIVNPKNQNAMNQIAEVQEAARTLRQQLTVLNASTEQEIDVAFNSVTQRGISTLVVGADGFFRDRRDQIIALAARRGIVTVYPYREYPDVGGLMSYGPDLYDLYRQLGMYTGRVIKGQKPADLPVMRSTKFELVINLKTARTLGVEIPPGVLAIADEVIE